MRLSDKLIEAFLNRMSQEEKERLLGVVVEKFFDQMTPQEKQRLIEKLILRLLEGVEMKEIASQLLTTVWKDSKESGMIEKMAKVASTTSGRISEFVPERMKHILRDGAPKRGDVPKEEAS